MAKKKVAVGPQRQMTSVSVSCSSRIFDTIPKAIRYLQEVQGEHPGVELVLDTDYGDLRFFYTRPETDEEFSDRLQREQWAREQAAEAARQEAERKADEAEYRRLHQKLGRVYR